jgi:hypothetical protein
LEYIKNGAGKRLTRNFYIGTLKIHIDELALKPGWCGNFVSDETDRDIFA